MRALGSSRPGMFQPAGLAESGVRVVMIFCYSLRQILLLLTQNFATRISWRSCKHDGSDEVLLHPLPDFATIDDNFCYKDFTAKLQPQRR